MDAKFAFFFSVWAFLTLNNSCFNNSCIIRHSLVLTKNIECCLLQFGMALKGLFMSSVTLDLSLFSSTSFGEKQGEVVFMFQFFSSVVLPSHSRYPICATPPSSRTEDIDSAILRHLVECASDFWSGGCGYDPRWVQQHSFMEIDHEIFSRVILFLLVIQERKLSVLGERICTSTV